MTSWKAWFACTQLATSAPSWVPSRARRRSSRVSSLKRCSALSSAASSSAVIFGVASSVARLSSSARTRKASRSSSGESVRTRTPRFGTNWTSPSAARRRSASRTGVRLTWYCSESCSCRSTVPGAISPATIASSSASAMSSALVPTGGMALSVGRSGGGRRDRKGVVVDPHGDERQPPRADPVLDRVRELLLVAVLDLDGELLVVVDELAGEPVVGERLEQARPVGLSGQLNGGHLQPPRSG